MEAATKKKRGRPARFPEDLYTECFNMEKRSAQNWYYAGVIVAMLDQKPGDFFMRENSSLRRQGVAEKIGRMYGSGKITEDEAKAMALETMKLYEKGVSCKELEKRLARLSKEL